MACAGEIPQFVSPGCCDAEVTLVLDDNSRLYVCKDLLVSCEFFKGLFSANFKEKDNNEVQIRDVSPSSMLLFLECQFGNKGLPLDCDSLCTLIWLADQFMCLSLQERLNNYLNTEPVFLNLSINTKLALVQAADKYKSNLPLLETCVRLCANLRFMDLSPLLTTKVSYGTIVAVYSMVTGATEHINWCLLHIPTHMCPKAARWNRHRPSPYDRTSVVEMNSKRVDAWLCSACGDTKMKETLTFEKVKAFEIDQNMLKG